MEPKKNGEYRAEITAMTPEGNGIARLDGYTVFVPGTAVGDECRFRLVKQGKSYGYGRLEEIFRPSGDRAEPGCGAYPQCGGCSLRHISYPAELALKENAVRDAFARLGGIHAPVRPILGAPAVAGYRNKAQYPIARDNGGELACGFYARRSHRVVPCGTCALQPPLFERVREAVLDFLREENIEPYDETAGKGLARHLYLRYGEGTGELMVCLVLTKPRLPGAERLIARLTDAFPEVKSIVLNVNPKNTNVILGERCVTLWGKDTISDILCGVKVELSPLSFYQVNRAQAERLYEMAIGYAGLTGRETLLDLYCGAGTIGLAAAGRVKELIGVEVVPAAVENARKNARANGIQNARFLCADAGTAAKRLAEEGVRPDAVIVDPPRKGLSPEVIEAIAELSPVRLVMVSCNPATAARDAALLRDRGYEAEEITPVDLFPRTSHVECVLLLNRALQEKTDGD